jgi:hypothetical protein
MVTIKERQYVQPICRTCGWSGRKYFFDEEGGKDYANLSAMIETRLGHLKDTALISEGQMVCHQIDYQSARE